MVTGIVVAGVLLLGAIGSMSGDTQTPQQNLVQPATNTNARTTTAEATEKITPTCDGEIIISDCVVDNIRYSTYIYHEAVEEKSHTETITTYKEEISSYCTLCNDGTYSPSCATGRGACSHHGGVAQWNAPRYSKVPEYTTRKVIDSPAQEAYYEKVLQ